MENKTNTKDITSFLEKIRNVPRTIKSSFLVSLLVVELFTACSGDSNTKQFIIPPKGNLLTILKDSLDIPLLKEEKNYKLRSEIAHQIAIDNNIENENIVHPGDVIIINMDMINDIIKKNTKQESIQDKEVWFSALHNNERERLLEVNLINEPNGQRKITEPYIKKHNLKPIKDAYELSHSKDIIQIGETEFKKHFVADRAGNTEFKGLPQEQQKKYIKDQDGTYYKLLFLHKDTWLYLQDLQKKFNEQLSKYGNKQELTFVISSLTRSQSGQKNAGMNATESISAHNVGIGIDIEFKDKVELEKMKESEDLYGLPILYYKNDNGERTKVIDPDVSKVAGKTLIEILNHDIQNKKILLVTMEKQNGCLHIVYKAY